MARILWKFKVQKSGERRSKLLLVFDLNKQVVANATRSIAEFANVALIKINEKWNFWLLTFGFDASSPTYSS